MQLLAFAIKILNGDVGQGPVYADWLSDHLNKDVKLCDYLRVPQTLRVRTVLNVVEKHGTKRDRKLMSKAFRKAMKQRHKHSKGATYASLKKRYSLQETTFNWFLMALRIELEKVMAPKKAKIV